MRQAAKSMICYVRPDGWKMGGVVYRDPTMPEPFDVRIETHQPVIASLAVKIETTGRVANRDGMYRCRVTFLGDGEPDTVCGGWVKLD